MSTLGIILGVVLLAIGMWTFLEARFGEGVLEFEILTAWNQCILGAMLLTLNAVPAGTLRLSTFGVLLLGGVWGAVAKYRSIRTARNERVGKAA